MQEGGVSAKMTTLTPRGQHMSTDCDIYMAIFSHLVTGIGISSTLDAVAHNSPVAISAQSNLF